MRSCERPAAIARLASCRHMRSGPAKTTITSQSTAALDLLTNQPFSAFRRLVGMIFCFFASASASNFRLHRAPFYRQGPHATVRQRNLSTYAPYETLRTLCSYGCTCSLGMATARGTSPWCIPFLSHYRPKDRPNAVRVVHPKTGEEAWWPLFDETQRQPQRQLARNSARWLYRRRGRRHDRCGAASGRPPSLGSPVADICEADPQRQQLLRKALRHLTFLQISRFPRFGVW